MPVPPGSPSPQLHDLPLRARPVEPQNPYLPFPREAADRSLPDYFEEVVERNIQRLAVRTGQVDLTYGKLNVRANRIARLLLARSPDRDEPAALLFGHGSAEIPALIGVLKSGKPYTAQDASFPLEWLRHTIEHLGARILLHDEANRGLAQQLAGALRISVACVDEADGGFSSDNLRLPLDPDRPCYIVYTSGSTGKPKGVIFTHRLRLAAQRDVTDAHHLCPDDRFSALHSIGFSASTTETHSPLLVGASTFPFDFREEGFDGLKRFLIEQRITVFHWVPSAFRRFAAELDPSDRFPDLRLIALGSEPVMAHDVELYRRCFGDHTLLSNRFGTTETGNVCQYVIDRHTPLSGPTMPSGYASALRQVVILDEAGATVPVGSVGEIAIKSRFISPGFWRDPELTAARFQELSDGDRLYRTGDLGRQDEEGCLVHLGRSDSQVKVRGHRVELVEVDAALLQLSGVSNAAATAVPDGDGDLRLVGCVVLSSGCEFSTDEARAQLRERVPDYLIPSSFAVLDELPLTPTGKVQRSALPTLVGLGLTSAEARPQQIRHWGPVRPTNPYIPMSPEAAEQSIPEWFETLVERYAERPAIVGRSETLTYDQLNRWANRAARYLRSRRPLTGEPVALMFDHGPSAIPALFAALKSGKPYVVLDPMFPVERLRFTIQKMGAGILLHDAANAALAADLAGSAGVLAGCMDEVDDRFGDDNLGLKIDPNAPSYVNFTSGSTGRPKGVICTHRVRLQNQLESIERMHFSPDDRFTALHSIAFSAAAAEIYGSLLTGASVYPLDVRREGFAGLKQCMIGDEITVFQWVSSAFRRFAGELDEADRFPHLRLIALGSEPVTAREVELYRRHFGDHTLLVNRYGTTESANSNYYMIDRHTPLTTAAMPSGYPPRWKEVLILDEHRNPLPPGTVGEIAIKSAHLPIGYWDEPELTAERWQAVPGEAARICFTGDLGRIAPDGCLENLGRRDHQVKVRGHRIELAEVEAAVLKLAGVRDAVVVALPDDTGETRLVGYVCFRRGQSRTASELAEELRPVLSSAMIPSCFVFLDELPLTPTGKILRSALPAPDWAAPVELAPSAPPETELQLQVAAQFAAVLDLPRVGLDDNFFALGGDSLRAAQLANRLQRQLGQPVTPPMVFETLTVRRLAERLSTAPDTAFAAPPDIPRLPEGVDAPLSHAQQRLWFLDRLEPDSTAFNEPLLLCFAGKLDLAVLTDALQEIVRRHSVLRTSFPLVNDQPVQRVGPPTAVPLPLVDLSTLPEEERVSARDRSLAQLIAERFHLATGPVLRARVIRLSETEHTLAIVAHHVATDGMSFNLLTTELVELYRAAQERRAPSLPELRIQFRDFAAWRQARENAGGGIEYWTRVLKDGPVLELPADFPRPPLPDHAGARAHLLLPPAETAALARLASEAGATPFMALLGALALVLGRWTGAEELVIGAPVIDRPHPDSESLIGVFLNSLALRIDLRGDPSFRELVVRVQQTAAGAYAHSDVPFEQVVDALDVPRDTSRHPVFEVMLNHLAMRAPDLELPGLTLRRLPDPSPRAKLPLTLYSGLRDGSLGLNLVYQTALFSAARMACLLDELRHVIETVTAAPDAPIGACSLLTPAALKLLPDPASSLPAAPTTSVIDTFLKTARSRPEAVALVQEGAEWSYGWLADAVERVAVGLMNAPSDVVGVTGARSFELVAAMLGVLRAGRVLLTLDPALPAARQELMLRQTGCALVLTAGTALEPLACPGVEVRAVGAVAPAGAPDACLPRVEALVGPAYVFFTSGSTGTPKAVLGTHEGLAHFIRWQGDAFAVQPGDRCALLTGLSFDVVLRDLFLPLTHGATLCLPQPEDVADGVALFAWLDRSRVSLLHAVPSLLRHWLAEYSVVTVERVALGGLRCLFLAGEPLTGELVTTWRSAFPQSGDVMNLYGPTETTLAKFCYRVPDDVEPGLQPVGQPLPDTEALVLALSGRRCGLYEPGEVAIRTAFRTRGYLNAETENALRFIENPFHQIDPDDRIYLTGDRGYFRADGDLVVVGRLDQQVKLRGVRIELGEVEAALRQHPAVREAAVDVRSSPHGEAVLAAYVVTTDRAALGELRRFLADRLPAALVPATYTVIDRLPLSPSGKLVRRSLPNPAPETATAPTPTGPRDDVERRLCAIWSEVLRAAPTSIHDDFFQAGGHSLLAVQLLIRVERAFGRALPLAAVMHAPTIAEMARLLETGDPPVGSPVLVPIQPSGHRVPIFAVHGIGGGVMCYLKLSALLGDEQPFYGLQAPALGGAAPRHLSVEEMAAEYVQAVREVQPAGPYHLLGLSFGGNIALEMAQQLRRSGAEVAFLGLLDSKGPGYPRFPGRLARAAAHVAYFLKQPAAGRSRYLRVRLVSLRDLIRRRMLGSWYRRVHRAGETLPRLLEDIGLGHLQAAREYRRDEYPGRIILFRAEQQPVGCIPEWDNGWSRVAQEGVEVHAVPGEHAEIVEEPYVQHLAQALRTVLSGIERTPER